MFHALANGRAPMGRSASARAGRGIGRRIGRASAVWATGCLLLFAPAAIIANAASCHPAKDCAATSEATASGTGSNGKDHSTSTKGGDSAANGTSSASSDAATTTTQRGNGAAVGQQTGSKQNNGNHNGLTQNNGKHNGSTQNGTKQSNGKHRGGTTTHHAGSTGQHHRAAGHVHRAGQPASDATIGQPGSVGEPTAPRTAIGRVNPPPDVAPADRGDLGDAEHGTGAPKGLSSRVLMPHPLGTSRPVEHVADALRFPAALLGVILVFLAIQQRADRRDHMLATAPVGSRQETLEFR
jgi:hypothetical protein